jgi:hypothetical protein
LKKHADGSAVRDLVVAATFYFPSPLKSGKAGTLTRSRRKSHESALAVMEFRLKGEL